MDLKHGRALVRLARQIVVTYLEEGFIGSVEGKKESYSEEIMGSFLTARVVEDVNRGKTERVVMSVGCPLPLMSVRDIVVDSTTNMAIRIRAHSLLGTLEIENLIFEIDMLTPPRLVSVKKPDEYSGKIRVGKDGLMIEHGFLRALLLPKVPLEKGWDVQDFLSECCMRAGFPPDAWLYKNLDIYTFQSRIFKEVEPCGEIVELSMESLQG